MCLKPLRRITILLIIVIIIPSLFLSACGGKNNQPDEQQSSLPPTEIPTQIPTPADRAVLIAPVGADAALVAEAQTLLTELASTSGLEFEVRQDLAVEQITSDVKIVVFLAQPDNLGSLVANAPNTRFVAISDQDWNPPSNVIIIRKRDDDVAFLSGYIAAMLAPNFRAGALLALENTQFNQSFQNGVSYYCGLCASSIYPLNQYPVISIQPSASPAETWQAAFNEINVSKINVLFLTREAISAQLLTYLSGMDIAIISSQPPLDEGRSRWAATIYADGISPIREVWNDLLAGNGGKIVNASIKIADNQAITLTDGSVWLSQGKLVLVEKIIELLRANSIYTLSIQ